MQVEDTISIVDLAAEGKSRLAAQLEDARRDEAAQYARYSTRLADAVAGNRWAIETLDHARTRWMAAVSAVEALQEEVQS